MEHALGPIPNPTFPFHAQVSIDTRFLKLEPLASGCADANAVLLCVMQHLET